MKSPEICLTEARVLNLVDRSPGREIPAHRLARAPELWVRVAAQEVLDRGLIAFLNDGATLRITSRGRRRLRDYRIFHASATREERMDREDKDRDDQTREARQEGSGDQEGQEAVDARSS